MEGAQVYPGIYDKFIDMIKNTIKMLLEIIKYA